jgi:hypothetical protein
MCVCVCVCVCVTVIIPYSGLLKPFGGVLSLARSYCSNCYVSSFEVINLHIYSSDTCIMYGTLVNNILVYFSFKTNC